MRQVCQNRFARTSRGRQRAGRRERKQSSRGCRLWLEKLEDRVTPSVLSTFELDGNPTTGVLGTSGSTTTSHDWDQVFADAGSPLPASGGASFTNGATSLATAGSFDYDLVNSKSDIIFTTGGGKDTQPISSWLYKNGSPQDKDDIENVFAAAYTDSSNGHLVLYAGMTRFSNSGDSTAGFWFLQDPTFGTPNLSPPNSGAHFSGVHMDGDILLVSDFSIGGSTSTISVYKWQGNDSTGSLVLVGGNATNTFAIVNSSNTVLPWSFTDKSNSGGTGTNTAAHGEFLEEGVDLTALNLSGCFSTFVGETRSSTSPTATLSDVAFRSFPLCGVTPAPFSGISKVGDDVAYVLQVANTGSSKLYPQNVTDTLLGNLILNGVVQSPVSPVKSITVTGLSGDGSLAPGAVLTVTVIRTVQPGDPDPTNDTTTFTFNPNANFSGSPISETVSNSVNLFQPSATMTETASPATTSNPSQVITYTFTVTNTSSTDSPNLVLDPSNSNDSFSDTLLGNLEADAIAAMPIHDANGSGEVAPGGSFTFTETRAIQPGDPTPLTDTSAAAFSLDQNLGNFGNIIHAGASSSVTLVPKIAAPGFNGISKVGDPVTYALTVTNTGPINVYVQNVTESLLGNIVVNGVVQAPVAPVTSIDASALGSGLLAPGASVTIYVTRTVQAGDSDPTNSTVNFVYNTKADFSGGQATASASDSVNLFQPSATLAETANPTTATHLGQVITYTFTVTNTSSTDSPNLVLDTGNVNDSFTDSLLGNLEADAIHAATGNNTATVASIAPGATFSFTETRAIQAGDPTPLADTSAVVFTLAQNLGNFGNTPSASSSASVTLVPHLTIAKTVTADGTSAVIHPGDTASFTITVTDDGAAAASGIVVTDLLPDASQLTWTVTANNGFDDTPSVDASGNLTANKATLAAGASVSVTVSAVIPTNIFGTPPGGTGNGDPVPSNLFELDGNATTQTTHDWDQVFADAGSPQPPGGSGDFTTTGPLSGASSGSFKYDLVNTSSDNEFSGGGSKDIYGIQQGPWLSTAGKPQGKDDIENAMAALYKAPNGDEILYAGATRFDNSGDATMGFWFFGNSVTANPGKNVKFTGTHTTGDILLISDFTTGGSVATIAVYKWVGDDATGSLVNVTAMGNPSTVAIVNGANITLPWTFTDKKNTGTNMAAPGEFIEEGVNLTGLGLSSCFASFLAETRSSQSTSATLSDFAIGAFPTCILVLPNTAHLHADNPATDVDSNQALIKVVDGGMPMLAESIGSASGTAGLTDQQLQAATAHAIDQWRAAGVDAQRLAALENQVVTIADLNHGELGWTLANHSWIDRTAEGWGWSVDGNLTQGKMDLLTVVTHELGHVLDMPYTATGVMELTLTPGMRLEAAHLDGAAALTGNMIVPVSQSTAPTEQGVRSAEGLAGLVRESSFSTRLSPTLSFEQTNATVLSSVAPGQVGPIIVNRQPALATAAPVDFSSRATGTLPSAAKRPEDGTGFDGLFDDDPEAATDWIDLLGGATSDWGAGQGSSAAPGGESASAGWQLSRDAYFAQENWDHLVQGRTEGLKGAWKDGTFVEAALSPMWAAGLAMVLGGYVGADAERFSARDRRRRFQV